MKQRFQVRFSNRANAIRYEADHVEVKQGKRTPRTTLRGNVVRILPDGTRKPWNHKYNRYDTGRKPIFK